MTIAQPSLKCHLMSLLFAFVLLLQGALLLPVMAADTTTLRFTTYNPPRGMEGQMATWLADEVKNRSKGQIEIQVYFGGSLLNARETLNGVKAGLADLGYLFVPYYPKELSAWTVAEPFLTGPVAPEKRAAFFWELYDGSPELEDALSQWNQKLIAIHVFGQHSVGSPKPIATLADLKGLRVRCAGGYDALHMSALGAQIVFFKGDEVYSAMQKGAIDANYTPITSYYKYKLYEIGDHHHLLSIPQFTGAAGLITINQDSFNKLSPDQQTILLETGRAYSIVESSKIVGLEKEYTEKMIKAGLSLINVPREQVLAWAKDCSEASKEKWLEKTQGKGGGKAFLAKAEALLQKYQE